MNDRQSAQDAAWAWLSRFGERLPAAEPELELAQLFAAGPPVDVDGPVKNLMRHTGPALSPFNAWTLVKGLETMPLRVRYSTDAALRIAESLEANPAVRWVKYPFLASHPQYELAGSQMSGGGTVITFERGWCRCRCRCGCICASARYVP